MSHANELNFFPATPFSDDLNPKQFILIKGAKVNNLKSVSVAIPRNKLVVVTGLSGSGKSSLAFDTLFAEGQRMYVESLNAYARQFLDRMQKPEVEYIKGVSPAIAIEQKVTSKNPRSTVGTTTEIYDYMKLLFARVGKTISPVSGVEVKKDTVSDVVDYLLALPDGTRFTILCPWHKNAMRSNEENLNLLLQNGFTRLWDDGEILNVEELIDLEPKQRNKVLNKDLQLVISRAVNRHRDEDAEFRMSDATQTAFFEGQGYCTIQIHEGEAKTFSDKFEADGIVFEEPSVNFFSFNNPYGACRRCEGFGKILGIDPDLVIPDPNLSIYEGAIAPWKTEQMRREWLEPLLKTGIRFDFPIHRAWKDLTQEQQDLVWNGNKYFSGIHEFFRFVESQLHKIQYRVMLSRYRGRTDCPDCRGTRLRKDAQYVKVAGKSITDLLLLPIEDLAKFFQELTLPDFEAKVAKRLVTEVQNRLGFMLDVGLGYLTLNRLASTLSGGESQRIKLATSLGSALVGSMYILDEPSIGLHPRDTERLIKVLNRLRDLGNTVIVVEHEEEVMLAADQLIDIGPGAGALGGNLVFQVSLKPNALLKGGQTAIPMAQLPAESNTIAFLTGRDTIPVPNQRRPWKHSLKVTGARENNLKNVDAEFPLLALTVVTGVSGSGKSTLVKKILLPAMQRFIGQSGAEEQGRMIGLSGSTQLIQQVEFVDQNPLGKSTRSNPVTYIKAYDHIRQLYADQPLAKTRNYSPGYFSFNVEGGRCEACQGEGVIKVEMQFMADVYLPCESCKGKRFKQEILEVTYKNTHISDVLDMTVDEAITFFEDKPKIVERIAPLQQVGLGYIKLGQSSSTLSGGEAQRVKLAYFLSKAAERSEGIFFIFDEPTTGLHFHDIARLLKAINALVDNGNTVLIIEHNPEVIKCADWVIDMGPEGGKGGGTVCFAGLPEDLAKVEDNHTARFLRPKLFGVPQFV